MADAEAGKSVNGKGERKAERVQYIEKLWFTRLDARHVLLISALSIALFLNIIRSPYLTRISRAAADGADASKKRPIEEGGAGDDRSKRANLGGDSEKPSGIKVCVAHKLVVA